MRARMASFPCLPILSALLAATAALSAGCTRPGGGGGGGGGGDEELADLTLTVASAVVVDTYTCRASESLPEIACADYELSVTLRHDGEDPLVRLRELSATIGATTMTDREPCEEATWLPEPGAEVGPNVLTLRYDGEGGVPTLYHRCGASLVLFSSTAVEPAVVDGQATVAVGIEGEDATHVAEGSATLGGGAP